MTDVTRARVFQIYDLMRKGIEINVGSMILSTIKKASYHQGRIYGFGGLLTKFLQSQEVEEEVLDYRPLVNTHPIDVSKTKGLDMTYRMMLTMPSVRL